MRSFRSLTSQADVGPAKNHQLSYIECRADQMLVGQRLNALVNARFLVSPYGDISTHSSYDDVIEMANGTDAHTDMERERSQGGFESDYI